MSQQVKETQSIQIVKCYARYVPTEDRFGCYVSLDQCHICERLIKITPKKVHCNGGYCFRRHPEIVNGMVCPDCKEIGPIARFLEHRTFHCKKQQYIRLMREKITNRTKQSGEQVEKNLTILANIKEDRTQQNLLRRDFAIYRLYRYCDIPTKELSAITGTKEVYIRDIIGRVFKALCQSDEACVFKEILNDSITT